MTRPTKSWTRILTPIFLGLAVSAICGAIYWREASELQKNILDREVRRMEIFGHFVEQDVRDVAKDLQQLADDDGLQSYLVSQKPEDLNRAVHRAWFFSKSNPDYYDKVRFLNEEGQEIIRINVKGQVVPADQLQNKAGRPFFQRTNVLGADQFYISAFDLNVEHDQLEQPLKPTLRVAVPVFDGKGERRGIYVINYLGANLISWLENFTPQYRQRMRILNSHGYWIKAAKPEDEWGFMLRDRADRTLAKSNPDLWAKMVREPQGQVLEGGGFFTWRHIVLNTVVAGDAKAVAEDDYLVMASEITPTEMNAYFIGVRQSFIAIDLVLLFLVAAAWWFFRLRQRAQQEMDRFFDLTRDLFCIAGFDGYFKRVNPAWAKTLGYTTEEMLAHPFVDFVHPDDRERTNAESADLALGGETVSFENRYRCKDGSYRWLSWSARALVEDQTIFATARDLTDRKLTEREILTLNEQLKRRASELEIANSELEAFSYSVSHDLRAPLRHINGFVEILQSSSALQAEPASMRQMNVIARAARDMGLLIDDLLSFSRTGRAEMHPMKIDLREVIDEAVRDLEMETQGRKVAWDIKPLPQVECDASLLRLVWVNLISNALKYTRPRDEARIEIGALPEAATPQGWGEVVFYIRDNGVGFDMRYASKLFGVFQRLHRADEFEGTGIGLANVQRIIHRHGGRVWAESKLDAGTTFYFSLPRSPTPRTDEKNETNTSR